MAFFGHHIERGKKCKVCDDFEILLILDGPSMYHERIRYSNEICKMIRIIALVSFNSVSNEDK